MSEAPPLQGEGGSRLVAVAAGLLVGAIALWGGGTTPEGGGVLAAAGAALFALANLSRRVGAPRRGLSGAQAFLLGIAALAALQAVPLPEAVARVVAPFAVRAREVAPGADGGVRISLDAGASWRAALAVAGIAFLSASLAVSGSRRAAPWLLGALVLALAAAAAAAIRFGRYGKGDLVLGLFRVSPPDNAYGSFANQNQYAAFVVLGIGPALALARSRAPLALRLLPTAVAAVAVGTLVPAGSRAGLLGAAVACAVAAIALAGPGRRRAAWIAVGAAVLALSALRVAGVEPLERLLPLREGETRRVRVWEGAADLAGEQPAFGIGLGAFAFAYPGEGRPDLGKKVSIAENDVLQWAAEGGVALLALLALGGVAAVRSLKRRLAAAAPRDRTTALVSLCGLVGIVPASLVGCPLNTPAIAAAAAATWAGAGWLAAAPRAGPP